MVHILNLFGTGIQVYELSISNHLFEKFEAFRLEKQIDWNTFFFELTYLEAFGFDHWNKLEISQYYSLFELTRKNSIEVKRRNKTLLKIKSSELNSNNTLFPLFDCFEIKQVSNQYSQMCKKITIHQYETGLFAKYEFNQDDFSIEELTFGIQTIGKTEYLHSIMHQTTSLKLVKRDTMIRGGAVLLG